MILFYEFDSEHQTFKKESQNLKSAKYLSHV